MDRRSSSSTICNRLPRGEENEEQVIHLLAQFQDESASQLILNSHRSAKPLNSSLNSDVGGFDYIGLNDELAHRYSKLNAPPVFCLYSFFSLLMPDAVVDYNLSSREWVIVEQEDVLGERTQVLYGSASSGNRSTKGLDSPKSVNKFVNKVEDTHESWNDLSEFYACEQRDVCSVDHTYVPLAIVYSRKIQKDGQNPGILHGHGAYGEVLDKRWRSDLKSLLDRGWVIAFADVRGGGGGGKSWHHDGRALKKCNSIHDYIACAKFLVEEKYVQSSKLAACGYSAGGLLVGAAINVCPDLFRVAILKVPFLDACNTLLDPIIPLHRSDYDEFGNPENREDFENIQRFSPYENIQKGVTYPAVLIISSFKTRFGVWEAAKWVSKVREYTNKDPLRPVLLNVIAGIVEENRYLQCKEMAMEIAFLIKMMDTEAI